MLSTVENVDGSSREQNQKLRASIELAQSSGLLLVRPAIRAGDDGSQWGTPVAVGGITRNADGTTYGTTFPDTTSTTDGKRLVQPGVEAQNVSGTSLEMGLVTLKLDRRGGVTWGSVGGWRDRA